MHVMDTCPAVIYKASCNFRDYFQPWQLAQNASGAAICLWEVWWPASRGCDIWEQVTPSANSLRFMTSAEASSNLRMDSYGQHLYRRGPSHSHYWGILESHAWPLLVGSLGMIRHHIWIHSYLPANHVSAVQILVTKWPFILVTCISLYYFTLPMHHFTACPSFH